MTGRAALLLLGLATAGAAQVPRTLGVQARIEVGGAPLTGPTTVTARLFDLASGGTPGFTETLVAAPDARGLVGLELGASTPLDLELVRDPLYLEFEVGGETLAPRLPLRAVPHALVAARAGTREERVRRVSCEGGAAAAGAALREALASLGPTSATTAFTVWAGPGTYDLGSASLEVPPYVRLRGAGASATRLQGVTSAGLLLPGTGAELADLAVLADHRAVDVGDATGVRLTDLLLEVAGARTSTPAYAVHVDAGALRLEGSFLRVASTGGVKAYGLRIQNPGASRPQRVHACRIEVAGTGATTKATYGVFFDGGASQTEPLELTASDVDAENAVGDAYGVVAVSAASQVDVEGCSVRASGAGATEAALDGGSGLVRAATSRLKTPVGSVGVCLARCVNWKLNTVSNVACP